MPAVHSSTARAVVPAGQVETVPLHRSSTPAQFAPPYCLGSRPSAMEICGEILAAARVDAPPSADLSALRKDLLIGESKAFLAAIAQIPQAARSNDVVLLWGETGTG